MSDFDEFIDFITDVIDEAIDNVPEDTELTEHVQDTLNIVFDKLSDSQFELDNEHKEILIEKLADALNLSTGEVSEQLETISAINDGSFSDLTADGVSEGSKSGKWNGEFGSAGCWDECYATTKDHGKRLSCGYQL